MHERTQHPAAFTFIGLRRDLVVATYKYILAHLVSARGCRGDQLLKKTRRL